MVAPVMRRFDAARLRRASAGALLIALPVLAWAPLSAAPVGSAPGGVLADAGRADHVYVKSKRDGSVNAVSGVVKRYELGKVVVAVGSKENNYDAAQVQSVEWGDVPPSFHEGVVYWERGAWADAAKSFRVASADASARDMVKAAAKRKLAESLLRGGSEDPTRFTEAVTECEGYLASYATNLEVPQVRVLHARSLWLAGKPAESGAAFRAVHAELKGDTATEGYDRLLCLQAGIQGGRALLEAKDTLGARELFTSLEAQVGPLLAGTPVDDPLRPALQAVLDEAALGAGFVDLAAGQPKQALTFFQGRVGTLNAQSGSAARYAALLGLGEALLADGKAREATLQLAKVVGLEPVDRDRAARAAVKLAEAYNKLNDADARQQACARVKDVLGSAGDTPAALRARQLAKELGC